MTPRTGRLAMGAVALIGFAVGVVLSAGLDLFPRSEAISIFGGAEKPSGGRTRARTSLHSEARRVRAFQG